MVSTPVYMPPETRIQFACHEAGHTVVAWMSGLRILISVSMPTEEFPVGKMDWSLRPSNAFSQIEDWIRDSQQGFGATYGRNDWEVLGVYLAGLAGEGIGTGTVKTRGAEQDLMYARQTAERIVKNSCVHNCPWGEVTERSTVNIGSVYGTSPSYEAILVLNRAYCYARSVIKAHRLRFDEVVLGLIDRNELSHEQLSRILGRRP